MVQNYFAVLWSNATVTKEYGEHGKILICNLRC